MGIKLSVKTAIKKLKCAKLRHCQLKQNWWRPCIKKTDDPSGAILCQHLNSDSDTGLSAGDDSDNDKMDCDNDKMICINFFKPSIFKFEWWHQAAFFLFIVFQCMLRTYSKTAISLKQLFNVNFNLWLNLYAFVCVA